MLGCVLNQERELLHGFFELFFTRCFDVESHIFLSFANAHVEPVVACINRKSIDSLYLKFLVRFFNAFHGGFFVVDLVVEFFAGCIFFKWFDKLAHFFAGLR